MAVRYNSKKDQEALNVLYEKASGMTPEEANKYVRNELLLEEEQELVLAQRKAKTPVMVPYRSLSGQLVDIRGQRLNENDARWFE